jgi:raffinose/stachyose/melibiose transport system substrate-binding protein
MKAMLRKLVLTSVLLTLALTLGISSAGAQEDGIVLNVFGPSSLDVLANFAPAEDQAAVQQAVIDGFLAENPDVSDVVWNAQGPIEEGVTRTLTAHLGGEPIDIIACAANPTNGTFIRRGIVRDISADIEPFRDRFDEAALAAYSIGDAVYGIPVSTMSTSSFFYNATMFEELGLEIPTSYEEFITLAADLREADVLPVLHQGATPWMWPMWYFETFAQTAGDPIAKTESNPASPTKPMWRRWQPSGSS